MYLRGLGIPISMWIDGMCGMTEQNFSQASDEDQFQCALRAMVITSYVLFKARCFFRVIKMLLDS
jgi:hypothetical protein